MFWKCKVIIRNFSLQHANMADTPSTMHKPCVQFIATGLPFNIQWFMQDGATPHTANVASDFPHDTFSQRVIFHHFPAYHGYGLNWQHNSPDITPVTYSFGTPWKNAIPKKASLSHGTEGPKYWNVWCNYWQYVTASDHKHRDLHFWSFQSEQWTYEHLIHWSYISMNHSLYWQVNMHDCNIKNFILIGKMNLHQQFCQHGTASTLRGTYSEPTFRSNYVYLEPWSSYS